jgi:uncharacterized phage protein (TIGR02218 family)
MTITQDYIDAETAGKIKPVELYHIWTEGGEHWYYTSGDAELTYPSDGPMEDRKPYIPATLQRSMVKYNSQLEATECAIQAGYVENPVLKYIAINPIEIIWVSIMRLHRDQVPLEPSVVFLGQIKSVSFKGVAAEIQCVGFEKFLNMPVPVFRYQINCNHRLFDDGCKLVKSPTYKVTTIVTLDTTLTQLTAADFATFPNGYFIGGSVEYERLPPKSPGTEKRTIIAHAGDTITMAYMMADLEDDDSVDAYPGCDRRAETCRDKFLTNNIEHFLGFPFIPKENPAIVLP